MDPLPFEAADEATGNYRCLNCGGHVTQQFIRVFGDNNGDIHGCLNCRTMRTLRAGGGIDT